MVRFPSQSLWLCGASLQVFLQLLASAHYSVAYDPLANCVYGGGSCSGGSSDGTTIMGLTPR